jgi:hypothetical protein
MRWDGFRTEGALYRYPRNSHVVTAGLVPAIHVFLPH